MSTINNMNLTQRLFFLFLLLLPLNLICQQKFEGYLEYSYRNEYQNKRDSLRDEKKLQAFFEKTGIEIGKRKSGRNKCFVKKDTLIISIYNKNETSPLKNNIQIGKYAYIEDLLTRNITELSKPNMERLFDENLKSNWRDSIKVNQIFKRDYSKIKNTGKKKLIKGYQCELYELKIDKNTYEKYWVNNLIQQETNQQLPIHFETIFFNGRLIIRKEAFYKGRVVIHELEELRNGKLKNLEKAINSSNIDIIEFK